MEQGGINADESNDRYGKTMSCKKRRRVPRLSSTQNNSAGIMIT